MTVATTTDPLALDALRVRVGELAARAAWPAVRLLEHKRGQLRELVRHAVARSPYYREALGADAEHVDLADLPTLSKERLMDQFDRVVTDPRLRRDDLEAFLEEADAGRAYLGDRFVFSTSGTTGVPGLFVYAPEEMAEWVALCLREFIQMGVTPTMRLVSIGAPSALHITRRLFAGFSAGRDDVPQLTVTTPLDESVAALNAHRPEAIATYASLAAELAEEQLQGRLRIEPHLVLVSSEVLTEEWAEAIRAAWGVDPVNVYASTEAPFIAVGMARDGVLEPSDGVFVEVVDQHDRPVPDGEPGTKVLLTNLVNRVQPLIRYELSDAAAPAGDGRLASIDGRSDDILELPARGGGTARVHPFRLRAPFATLADVRRYQIVLDPDGLRVRVELRPGAPRDVVEHIRGELAAGIEDAGAVPPRIDVEPVDAIAREPGHAGKRKLVTAAR